MTRSIYKNVPGIHRSVKRTQTPSVGGIGTFRTEYDNENDSEYNALAW